MSKTTIISKMDLEQDDFPPSYDVAMSTSCGQLCTDASAGTARFGSSSRSYFATSRYDPRCRTPLLQVPSELDTPVPTHRSVYIPTTYEDSPVRGTGFHRLTTRRPAVFSLTNVGSNTGSSDSCSTACCISSFIVLCLIIFGGIFLFVVTKPSFDKKI